MSPTRWAIASVIAIGDVGLDRRLDLFSRVGSKWKQSVETARESNRAGRVSNNEIGIPGVPFASVKPRRLLPFDESRESGVAGGNHAGRAARSRYDSSADLFFRHHRFVRSEPEIGVAKREQHLVVGGVGRQFSVPASGHGLPFPRDDGVHRSLRDLEVDVVEALILADCRVASP